MPYLCDVAHDGFLCTFSNRSAPDGGKWCGPLGQAAWSVRAGGLVRPSRTQSHPAGPPFSSKLGMPPCWASPLAFGLIGTKGQFNTYPPLMSVRLRSSDLIRWRSLKNHQYLSLLVHQLTRAGRGMSGRV
jgi:hypothetical protein